MVAFIAVSFKMSDSDEDSDLIQEAYDPDDDLNVYGSPVARPETSTGQTPVLHERTQVSVFIFVLPQNFY